ncbi:MAG: NAD-dependent epimerase/dehydratase family protein [Schwartzia sp.]|nr:NAD-dependent epimerase/dehydratase family protein [Schwartzia sp. (in: firmicutes)]MBR1885902.1 NAD-dependent epimerase/dehydratase family protein [Schwartzia sp. (in: firmicutes)]
MEKEAKVYVAGHRRMVGSAILRELQRQGYTNFVLRTHQDLDFAISEIVSVFVDSRTIGC